MLARWTPGTKVSIVKYQRVCGQQIWTDSSGKEWLVSDNYMGQFLETVGISDLKALLNSMDESHDRIFLSRMIGKLNV